MMRMAIGLAALALWLAGCDTLFGVARSATLTGMPAFDCVEHAIRTTPGVGSFSLVSQGGEGRTYHYGGAAGPVVSFVQFQRNTRGEILFRQYYQSIHTPPPQDVIDSTRPVMLAVERRLASACGMAPLAAGVTEHCSSVTCGPIPSS